MDPPTTNVDNLNEARLKKLLLNFERQHQENQKLRIKHSESPAKFAHSETELFAVLDELQAVATQPELFHVLLAKKSTSTLLGLLSHENADISAKVIGMLQEFTDIDDADEQEHTEQLIRALQEENVVELLIANLTRFDETIKEEAQAINNSLAVIDNLIDFDSTFAVKGSAQLIEWILKQLAKSPEFNAISLSMAELLSVLLMNSQENRIHLAGVNGIEILLQRVAYYRRVAPTTGDEHEFLEQLINCLCIAVTDCDENRESFFKEEGVDLVELILREKREAVKKSNLKLSILKLFNHVLTSDKPSDANITQCCERFLKVLGLRVLFPIFYNPKLILNEKVKRHEFRQKLDEAEEHTSAIILALLKYCQNNEHTQRIMIKFCEKNFEKLDRLLDLHEKYFRLVQQQLQQQEEENSNEESDGDIKSSVYFTLRAIDYIILLTYYFGKHFESYDPSSGETFTSYMGKLLAKRPELKHQVALGTRRHITEVAEQSLEEANSLKLLLEHFI